jgi:hypothetical protein
MKTSSALDVGMITTHQKVMTMRVIFSLDLGMVTLVALLKYRDACINLRDMRNRLKLSTSYLQLSSLILEFSYCRRRKIQVNFVVIE